MSISTTIAALQQLHGTIVANAPTRFSAKVESLPRVLTLPGKAEWGRSTFGERKGQQRRYRVQVLTGAVDDGGDAAILQAIDLMQQFGDLYLSDQAVVLDAGGMQITLMTETPLRDSGLVVLNFGGKDYHGFEFEVTVDEHWG